MGDNNFENATWPTADESALVLDTINLPVQINGKMRGIVKVSSEANQDEIFEEIKKNPEIAKYLEGTIVKTIFVPKKIINIIVK